MQEGSGNKKNKIKIPKVKEQKAVAENNWGKLRVMGRHGGVKVMGNARERRGVLISRITMA